MRQLGQLGGGDGSLQPQRGTALVLGQPRQQFRRRHFQEAGRKLMQQVTDFFRSVDKQARFFIGAMAYCKRTRLGMFKRASQL